MSHSPEALQAIRDRRRRVAQMFVHERMTCGEIARRLDVSSRTVVRDLRELNLSGPPQVPMSDEELARMREMLEEGACYAEVARTTGRSERAIWRKIPGYSLDRKQIAERAAWGRQMARI